MISIAVFGLPHSGTSVLWDVLCHDPQYERYIYEPLRQSVMDALDDASASDACTLSGCLLGRPASANVR